MELLIWRMRKADTAEVLIGLGSNQGNRFIHLQKALFKIDEELVQYVIGKDA